MKVKCNCGTFCEGYFDADTQEVKWLCEFCMRECSVQTYENREEAIRRSFVERGIIDD